jgi:hypothetical protein
METRTPNRLPFHRLAVFRFCWLNLSFYCWLLWGSGNGMESSPDIQDSAEA